jgi:hypothetical protein
VQAVFDAHRHKTIAAFQADGSPWVFRIGACFEHGELVFGSMVKRAGRGSVPGSAVRLTPRRS